MSHIAERIYKLRLLMKEQSIDALLVGSKDEFLNEYVNQYESKRVFISGFDGTAGDVLITMNDAFLIVDGRYHIQAENQVDKNLYTIEKAGIDVLGNRINEYLHERMFKVLDKLSNSCDKVVVGFDPTQISVKMVELLNKKSKEDLKKVTFKALNLCLVSQIKDKINQLPLKPVYNVPEEITGMSSVKKLSVFREYLTNKNIDAYFISKLDELAYITNLRGTDIEYNSTFKGYAFITNDEAFLFTDLKRFSCQNLTKISNGFDVSSIDEMFEFLKSYLSRKSEGFKVGFDPSSTNYYNYSKLDNILKNDFELVSEVECPVKTMKSVKTDSEINYLKKCFNFADKVFDEIIGWLNSSIRSGNSVTEYDLKQQIELTFKKYGAERLSFDTIAAAGSNSAIVHYTESSKERVIQPGEFVLIDAGAYFSGGYATDLTRTILAGGDNSNINDIEMKTIYTTVLKAAIRGLTAEIPPETSGVYLDNIVRSVVKDAGYDFNHGTGHGIGILVHEAPPSISPAANEDIKLKKSMIFSIEPGIYIENQAGVRFENIATLIPHPDKEKANLGWLKVQSLTFSPVDESLINYDMLDQEENNFLELFKENYLENCKALNLKG